MVILMKETAVRTKVQANIYDLHQAIQRGQRDVVEQIVEAGSVNLNWAIRGTTALSLTLYKEKFELFHLMLEYHHCKLGLIDLNKLSKDEKQRIETPLITACRLNSLSPAESLLRAGVHLDEVDNYEHTALWVATRERNIDMVRLLIENGASVNCRMKWNQNPLFYATDRASKRTQLAEYLIQQGADVCIDQSRREQPMPLLVLAAKHNWHFACLLVEVGCHITRPELQQHGSQFQNASWHNDLLQLLQTESSSPAPLQRIARNAIRKNVAQHCGGKFFAYNCLHLPLPKAVIDSILLRDILPPSIF